MRLCILAILYIYTKTETQKVFVAGRMVDMCILHFKLSSCKDIYLKSRLVNEAGHWYDVDSLAHTKR